MRQFVACQFKPGQGREYTFHNDGPPVAVGDHVRAESRHGECIVHVSVIDLEPPSYETKPILGLADLASAAPEQGEE